MKRTPFLVIALIAVALVAVCLPGAALASPPTNDDFANATVLDPGSLPFSEAVGIDEATLEATEPSPCGSQHTVWYAFTASHDALFAATSSGSDFFDARIAAYESTGGGLSFIGCRGGAGSPLFVSAEQGVTYYLQAGDLFGAGGTITVTLEELLPPANDDFVDAAPIDSVPFSTSIDASGATIQANEPTPSCGSGQSAGSVWYAFTPTESRSYSVLAPYSGLWAQVAVYTGSDLVNLSQLGCRTFGQPLTFAATAGTVYYVQAGGLFGDRGTIALSLDVTPDPVAAFGFNPGGPSTFDTVQFFDQSQDPGGVGLSSEIWDFGDGSEATNPGCCPTHRYAADGDYTVELQVTTTDGRTASVQQVVHVRTHDVALAKVIVPQTASVGQSRAITVGLTNSRYAETVRVQLLKSVAGGGWHEVGVLMQYVPVRSANRTTNFTFNYTFAPEDAALGKVSFQAIASIENAHDAIPADNTFISLPTKVH